MKKLGIGIIGAGGIAQGCHMPGYASMPDLCEIVAVADTNEAAAKAAAEKFGVPNVFSDYRELLALPDVDAVSVATPNRLHRQPTIDALLAGKHVLCEKPMAMNAQECREMIAAEKQSGKLLQIALQWRFSAIARFMRKFIDGGNMGKVYYARAQALRRREVPGWGVFIDKEQQGGGPLIDIGVHILDFTLFLMGYPKPVTATANIYQAMAKDPKHWNAWGDYDRSKFTVEDFAAGFIRFEDGSAVTLESSFMSNIRQEFFGCQLFGTEAGAELDLFSDDPVTIYTELDQQLFDMKPRNLPRVKSMHTDEVVAFVHAILNGEPSPVPGEQGLILNAIFDAMYRSGESGREERVEL
ncbi:MAG: 1,5-anhydro-D-fructose reductase [Fimbriimonadales bacterium]|nr:1,5-anhydro-D-fructose reductase [Fimbriimonadales bacterium]